MSEARRVFTVQLGSIMDALLKTAVCEITKIFEGSLCEQQLELTQQVEEISVLRGKLEEAERRLRGNGEEGELDPAVDLSADVETSSQAISPVVTDPETQEEVPDYWCAPVQCDEPGASSLKVGLENECPSVTLKPLSVSLWRMPDIKQEVEDDFESHLMTALSSSPPGESAGTEPDDRLKAGLSQQLSPPPAALEVGHRLDPSSSWRVKQEELETPIDPVPRRRRQKKTPFRNHTRQTHASKSKSSAREKVISHTCKFCRRVFDTETGLKVHAWQHKKCSKCHKVFPFPSFLRQHMKSCQRVKEEPETTKEKLHTNSHKAPLPASPSKKHPADSLSPDRTHSDRETNSPKKYTCKHCQQNFRLKRLLKMHVKMVHEEPWEYHGDPVWAAPAKRSAKQPAASPNPPRRLRHQAALNNCQSGLHETMGRRSSKESKKDLGTRGILKEHLYTHPGDMPLQCGRCGKRCRFRASIDRHRRMCTGASSSWACKECKITFANQILLNRHMRNVHQKKANSCRICGKAFSYRGCLRKHYERVHA